MWSNRSIKTDLIKHQRVSMEQRQMWSSTGSETTQRVLVYGLVKNTQSNACIFENDSYFVGTTTAQRELWPPSQYIFPLLSSLFCTTLRFPVFNPLARLHPSLPWTFKSSPCLRHPSASHGPAKPPPWSEENSQRPCLGGSLLVRLYLSPSLT